MGGNQEKVGIINLIIVVTLFLSSVLSGSAFAACRTDIPTSTNVYGFYHGALTVNGAPVQVGAEVIAYVDTVAINNGCVGKYVVDIEGMYGPMAVYGDDVTTTVKDGAVAGDVIRFFLCQAGVEYPFNESVAFTVGDAVEIRRQNVISSKRLGLYKDGQKIIDYEFALPQEVSEPAALHRDKKIEKTRLKGSLSNHLKDVKRSSGRFKEQKEFVEIVLECQELVKKIKQKLDQGDAIESELDLLIQKENDLVSANQEILRKFDTIEQRYRNNGYSKVILERHTNMVDQHKKSMKMLIDHLKDLEKDRDKNRIVEKIDAMHSYFLENKFKEDPPLIHNQDPPMAGQIIEAPLIKKKDLQSVRLKTGEYNFLSSPPPNQADLEPTIDVQFTDDIIDLADQLDHSPVKIYEYMKDNFEFEPYLGSRKGSHVTLIHRSGNDYDIASLLIALLRVSDIPARYATGIVEMPPDRAENWLGIEDGIKAVSILYHVGMEAIGVSDGDQIVAIQCRRVWVEAYIPYTNYRGIRKDETGKMWVPLDCAFKQYDYQAGIDIPKEMAFDAKAFIDDYISTFHDDSPVELFKQKIVDYLAVHYPGLAYEKILRTKAIHLENLGLIPGSLPYKLVAKDGEFAEIPEDKRYKIGFRIYGSGSSLDYTANLPEIAGKRVTVSYIGATPDDQQIIDDSGGIFGVEEPWMVHVKPVLKVDGCDVAIGSGEVTLGISQDFYIDFNQPVGAINDRPIVFNTIIAGTYLGIGINTWKVATNPFAPLAAACEESYTGYLLHDTALRYLGREDASRGEINKIMQMDYTRDVSLAIVGHIIDRRYSSGDPIIFEWSGLYVDADRDIITPYFVTSLGDVCNYLRLAGADGSISENRVFEDTFNEEAVSTIKILELASDMGIPIYEIDISNVDAILPLLTVSSSVKAAVESAVVDDGHTVTIARDNITYFDWTGTGYIDMKPTCGAGYIISGGRNGGETVNDWEIDPKASCINATINSISPAATNDIYCAQDTRYLVFDVTIHPYDNKCNSLPDYNRAFSKADPPNPMTIKDIADRYGAGVYTFHAGSTGECAECGVATKSFTIFKIELTLPHATRGIAEIPFTTEPGEQMIYCVADIKPDELDTVHNHQIVWEVFDDTTDTLPSGDPSEPGSGSAVTFTINPPPDLDGRGASLSYKVKASLAIDTTCEHEIIIRQDNLDGLRQEYVDLCVPTRHRRENFDRTSPPPEYSRLLHEIDICTWHDWWIVDSLIGYVQILDNAYDGELRVTSGYRCPVGNQRAGGAPNSIHMQGLAVDWNQLSSEENYKVWQASESASRRYLYDQNDDIIDNSLILQYAWPLMPPGIIEYTHGHTDWR